MAATTWALWPPNVTSAPVRPTSMRPTPPGVIGNALSSRTSDQAANASTSETSAAGTPTARNDTSRIRSTDTWPATVASVSRSQRWRSVCKATSRRLTRDSAQQARRVRGRGGEPERPRAVEREARDRVVEAGFEAHASELAVRRPPREVVARGPPQRPVGREGGRERERERARRQ